MSRVIAVMACGFTLAACSASMPSLNFLSSAPPSEALRIESDPPGAEAKTSLGTDLPHALRAHRPTRQRILGDACAQRVPAADRVGAPRGLAAGGESAGPRLAPNPVYVELQPASVSAAGEEARPRKRSPLRRQTAPLPVASRLGRPSACSRTRRNAAGAGGERRAGGIRDQLSLAVAVVAAAASRGDKRRL